MSPSSPRLVASIALSALVAVAPSVGLAGPRATKGPGGPPPPSGPTPRFIASAPVAPVRTIAAREAPPPAERTGPARQTNPRHNFNVDFDPSVADLVVGKPDPLLALQEAAPAAQPDGFETPIFDFDGQGYTFLNPPDTVGDVGAAHYIQMINATEVAVYDKTTGGLIQAFDLTSLGGCATGNGDPVVLYDQLADRWLLSEFGSGSSLCVFVSQTPDPLGAYFSYQFATPGFPDYPKYGVWPDAYYVTTNESSPSQYAFDRAAMLAGNPATSQRFTAPSLSGFGFQAMTPADLDGAMPPPAGAPGYILRHRDTEVHGPAGMPSNDLIEIWAFHVDWATPGNSTFAKIADLQTAEFDSTLCGLSSFFCMAMPGVAQGSGSSLDPIREVVMFRLAYRNFGDHETLVGNFVTDIDGDDTGGVRWFELRKVGAGAWTLFQEGTYAPTTTDNRWLGAIAMDGAGNIALGFNVSSNAVHPSLRYAGRLVSDPLGTLPQGEYSLVAGTGVNGSNRWGDYAAMSVDPVDDCTFWFTGEWNAASQWSTRIGAFRFDACGEPGYFLSVNPTARAVCKPADATYTVQVGQIAGYTDAVTLGTSGAPAGATVGFGTNPVTPPGSTTLTIGTSGVAAGHYSFDLTGSSTSGNKQVALDLDVFAAAPGAPTLVAPADGAVNVSRTPTFSWNALADASSYAIEVATDAGFSNVVASASGLAAPSWPSNVTLASNTRHYWRVRASNACGDGAASATFDFTTVAAPGDCGTGTRRRILYEYGFEAGANGWSSSGTGDSWAISTANPHAGAQHYHANDPAVVTDQRLVSPAAGVPLPTGEDPVVVRFWHLPNMEPSGSTACYDGGILEVSTNGGTTWTQVPNANLLVGPYRGTISSSFSNPLANLPAWCGETAYLETIADVSSYAGQTAIFRLRLGSDTSVSRPGWDVDDVVVQSCQPALFWDDFESGDSCRWEQPSPGCPAP